MEQTYQLKFSMGTQSEVIPKTPYKELENHRFLARINATLSLQQKFKKINAFIKRAHLSLNMLFFHYRKSFNSMRSKIC